MHSPEQAVIPEWARRERAGDLAWIGQNLFLFWPIAQRGYAQCGRGALTVDTTATFDGAGHPMAYLPQTELERLPVPDARRMVSAYDPHWEFVTVLFKDEGHFSTYRIGLPGQRPT
ncbi:MAG: hypothetical protein HY259_04965 [Chloroflexi bacterium]|nr:hypothetical protein [Chloroflexota bacterium]